MADGAQSRNAHAVAFNALTRALGEKGEWVPLSVRLHATDKVLAALDEAGALGYEPFVAAGPVERPLSNREFIAAEVERLGLQPKVDAMWAEIENAPPPPPGWCTWHQTHVAECPGDTDECREARTEIGGGGDRG